MEKIIINLIKLQIQLRILHWQTPKFSEHEAFGKTYEALDGLIDELVEVHQGKYGKISLSPDTEIELVNYDQVSIMDVLEEFARYLVESFNASHDEKMDSDCLNIRDEILAVVNKLKYLLTLQ